MRTRASRQEASGSSCRSCLARKRHQDVVRWIVGLKQPCFLVHQAKRPQPRHPFFYGDEVSQLVAVLLPAGAGAGVENGVDETDETEHVVRFDIMIAQDEE